MDVEAQTVRKVSARLIPFLIICYFVAYLDRVNVGFAALTMNRALGLTATMFGFGSGIFFLTYFVFEVPSNLLLDRFGARRWIARIMVSWGILSALTAFIPGIARATGLSGETTFYIIRALLGFAEAGFFPGIIFYLTLWFPSVYRGRIIGSFMVAIPLSSAIGAPISGLILGMDGVGGLAGWQWLFIIEAAPALLLGIVTYFYLTDRPADAHWLAPDERAWLSRRLDAERRQREATHSLSVTQAMFNPRVWALSLVYFGAVACVYGVGFWLPQIIKAFGLSNAMTGWVTAIPYAIGAAFMVAYGYHSDAKARTQVTHRRRARDFRRRHRRGYFDGQSDDDRRCLYHRHLRRVRGATAVLDSADRGVVRYRSRGGHRRDQLDRQPRRLLRALCHGMDQRRDRKLCRWSIVDCHTCGVAMVVVLVIGHDRALERTPAVLKEG